MSVSSGKAVIYVVDDEPMLLELTKLILGNFHVHTFRSGEEALQAYTAARNPPDLLITDFAMGGMNGLELIEACRKLHSGQRTLLLSGTVTERVNTQASSQANAFLAKPYQPTDLLTAVNRLLSAE